MRLRWSTSAQRWRRSKDRESRTHHPIARLPPRFEDTHTLYPHTIRRVVIVRETEKCVRKQISFLPYGIRDVLVGAVESMKHLSVSFRQCKQIVYHNVHLELTFRAIPTETVESHLIQSERIEQLKRLREILSLQNRRAASRNISG